MLMLHLVCLTCGKRIGWAWYGVVAILSALLSADKEAAAVFAFLGYYPIIKPKLDKLRFGMVWKLLLFNTAVAVMYWLLLAVFGMTELLAEYREMGTVLLGVALVLGNVTFWLIDRILSGKTIGKNRGGA
jgi:hypothetical protein